MINELKIYSDGQRLRLTLVSFSRKMLSFIAVYGFSMEVKFDIWLSFIISKTNNSIMRNIPERRRFRTNAWKIYWRTFLMVTFCLTTTSSANNVGLRPKVTKWTAFSQWNKICTKFVTRTRRRMSEFLKNSIVLEKPSVLDCSIATLFPVIETLIVLPVEKDGCIKSVTRFSRLIHDHSRQS